MKIQALLIAAALAAGTAFAADDTTKAPADSSAKSADAKPAAKTPKKMAKKAPAKKHQAARAQREERAAVAEPTTDTSASDRQARIDEALAKYRQTEGTR